MLSTYGYIYLIKEREFIDKNVDVYKIGRTVSPCQRLIKYPKSSELIICIRSRNNRQDEKKLINLFSQKYIRRSDIGSEYFQGNPYSMVDHIYNVVRTELDKEPVSCNVNYLEYPLVIELMVQNNYIADVASNKVIRCLSSYYKKLVDPMLVIPSEYQMQFYDAYLDGSNIVLTGPAGCGKSYCINQIAKEGCLITATTGRAAHLLNGTTIDHYICQWLTSREYTHKPSGRKFGVLSTLVIDESSMLGCEKLYDIDHILRYMYDMSKPFGGVQVILVGDFLQLPPVKDESIITSPYLHDMGFKVINMRKIFRQNDSGFKQLLNCIRRGSCNKQVEHRLYQLQHTVFPDSSITETILVGDNLSAAQYNTQMINYLPGISYVYTNITLKVGSQVMLIKNIDISKGLVNGSKGVVTEFIHKDRLGISRTFDYFTGDHDEFPSITFDNGLVLVVGPYKYTKYSRILMPSGKISMKKVEVVDPRLPISLAWAITVHKAQGSSITKLTIDCSKIRTPGQFYTALSRATSEQGVKLIDFRRRCVQVNMVIVKALRSAIMDPPRSSDSYPEDILIRRESYDNISIADVKTWLGHLVTQQAWDSLYEITGIDMQLTYSRSRSKSSRTIVNNIWNNKISSDKRQEIKKKYRRYNAS